MSKDQAAPASPGVPPLRQAARGLGLIFVATAFGCMTYIAEIVLRGLAVDWRWRLITLTVWGVLELLAFRGRWLCLRARASRKTKMILRASLTLTGIAAFLELALPLFLALLIFHVIEVDLATLVILSVLKWAGLAVPLLWLVSAVLLLFYLRGLAQALELYEFASDALSIMAETLMIFVIIPPFLVLLAFVCYYARVLDYLVLMTVLTWPGLMLAVLLLAIYPFIRFCNLLTGFRDAILRCAAKEEADKHQHKHHSV